MTVMDDRDAERLELLDRIADRVPELDLEQQSVEWMTLEDGHEALLVNGGGIDGGAGAVIGLGTASPDQDAYSDSPAASRASALSRKPSMRMISPSRNV